MCCLLKPVRDPGKQSDIKLNVTELKPQLGFMTEVELSCLASRCFYYHSFAVDIPFTLFFKLTDNQVFHLNI